MAQTSTQHVHSARRAISVVQRDVLALSHMTVSELRAKYEAVFDEETRSNNKPHLQKKIAFRIQELAQGGLSTATRERIAALAPRALARFEFAARKRRAFAANHVVGAQAVESVASGADVESTRVTSPRDPRLPPAGTVLRKVHRGAVHEVTVLGDGFSYQGQRFRSLSKVAKIIAGTNWNGFAFFASALAALDAGGTPGS